MRKLIVGVLILSLCCVGVSVVAAADRSVSVKGKKVYPVREITIAGNILDLMKNVAVVGSDLRFAGRIGSPSLLVKELSIAGK